MDLTRDPRFNTFMLNQNELKNQRSTNIQVQHYFNSIHHPNNVRIVAIGQNEVKSNREQERDSKSKVKVDQTVSLYDSRILCIGF